MALVAEEDMKLPPRTAVSGRRRLMTGERMKEEVLQLVPIEEDSPEENEVVLCETVVPMMLANQAHKTIKIK